MSFKDIKLWENNAPDADQVSDDGDLHNKMLPTLTPYLLSGDIVRPAIIICPGGSFQFLASTEGKPIAQWLNQIGFHAFVLNYRVAPYTPFTSTKDAIRAVRYVRYHSKDFNIDSERIGMIGFSAGGYLTAFIGTHYENGTLETGSREAQIMSMLLGEPNINDPIDQTSVKLNAIILCYAETAPFSQKNLPPDFLLTNDITIEEMIDFTSTHKQVSMKTPPTFLWITANDHWKFQFQNFKFARAILELNLPFDFHIFSKGPHALGLGEDEPTVAIWLKLCENWLNGLS